MNEQTYDAVFEKGVFRLVKPVQVPMREGQKVKIVVESAKSPEDILTLLATVYEGLSEKDVDDIEAIALDRSNFFEARQ